MDIPDLRIRRVGRTHMTFCSGNRTLRAQEVIAVVLALGSIIGCNSVPTKAVKPASGGAQMAGVAANGAGPDIDLNCVVRHIQGPTESFHYHFTDLSDNPWQKDAEITPQNI